MQAAPMHYHDECHWWKGDRVLLQLLLAFFTGLVMTLAWFCPPRIGMEATAACGENPREEDSTNRVKSYTASLPLF